MKAQKSVFIPYLLHNEIQKYFLARNKDMSFLKTFATGLYPADESFERSNRFSIMAENLLLYETCYISFDDYLYLCEKIKIDVLLELLKTEAIKVIDTKKLTMGCVFGMSKSQYLTLFPTDSNRDIINELKNKISNLDINEQLGKDLIFWSDKQVHNISRIDQFVENITNESMKDLENNSIRRFLGIDEMGGPDLKLPAYENFKLNRIFFLNYSLQMASHLGVKNVHNESIISELFNNKVGRYVNSELEQANNNFVKILDFEGMRDVNNYILNGILSFSDILKIRESKNCIRFRDWIHNNNILSTISPEDKNDITAVYNEACKESKNFYNDRISKVLRIGIPEIVGLFGIGGTIISKSLQGTDFAINKLLNGWKPNLFIDSEFRNYIEKRLSIRKLQDENEKIIKIYGRVSRNSVCPCGSGKKYKKCHGKNVS